ncbi:mechanosensitive ion channel family protein [Paludifilum halophilum]|uniref:Mechanosensitive ion channel protein n=1 Tax=Paludifilum halophilum TaxID=1642702 RepID=A0A235B5F0_9BACL|nr:mechanosensitive ion channel family protein [Paludifilum halophilum]OYD07127.1 mechanosensitive ion channel protein [Paludifilum halophilum]
MNWLAPLITSGIIIVIAFIVYGVLKGIVSRIVEQRMKKQTDTPAPRIDTMKSLLTSVIGYAIFFITLVAILDQFGVNPTGIIASAGILGLAIGFGAQGLVSDVVTGFFVLVENQVNVGEYVTINGYSGVVEETGLRVIKVRGFNGDLHYIPNREIGSLTNHSRGNMQALVDIGIAYNENVDQAVRVLQEKCDQVKEQLPSIVEGPNVLGVQHLGSSDVVIRILAKTENGEQWAVERTLRKELKEALDTAGVEIPFPTQTLVHKNEKSD